MGKSKKTKAVGAMLAFVIFFAAVFIFTSNIAPTAFAILQSADYSLQAGAGSLQAISNPDYILQISSGDALQGRATNPNYNLELGPLAAYVSEPEPPQISNVSESTATPALGESVKISASAYSEAGLAKATFYTNDGGNFSVLEEKSLSGNSANIFFIWDKKAADGTSVSWKIVVADVDGKTAETSVFDFVVGAKDLSSPTISSVSNFPTEPVVGDEVHFYAEVQDDFGLAFAVLEVNGKNITTATLVGKSAKADFKLIPEGGAGQQILWKVFARDSSGKEAVSQKRSFALSAKPVATTASSPAGKICPESKKPKQIEGLCIGGKRKTTDISCDASTRNWSSKLIDMPCLLNTSIFGQIGSGGTLDYILLALVSLLLAGSAFIVYLYKKDPETFREMVKGLKEKINNFVQKIKEKFFWQKPEEQKEKVSESKPPAQEKPQPKIFVKSLKVPKKEKKPPV